VYVSFEEDEADIRGAAESIGLEGFGDLVDSGDIVILDKREMLRETDFSTAVDKLLDTIEDGEFDRLVLDSLSMFQLFFDAEQEKRTYLLKFSDILKANGLTSLLINEQGAVFPDTEVGLENFLTDGNIYFIQTPTDSGVNRYVWVAKMRKQDIDTDIFPMEIGEGGITVHERAGGFSMMGRSEEPLVLTSARIQTNAGWRRRTRSSETNAECYLLDERSRHTSSSRFFTAEPPRPPQ